MKTKGLLLGSALAVLLLLVAVTLLQAQGPSPGGGVSAQGNLGTGFTYQGRLTDSAGSPISDTCDFQFVLWNAETGGTQIGTQTIPNVQVTEGFFTVRPDFGGGAFQGDARWLQIKVKCTGDADYADLGRRPITPAPYALALPGLWTQQNATSPNLIGGYSGNSVADGVVGATIGGGGEGTSINSVTQDYGTVGGGRANTAGGSSATVGGGWDNTANGGFATVGGGTGNRAEGHYATVGGGGSNSAKGYAAAIGGGIGNVISSTASYGFIGGGRGNVAGETYAVIAGGYENSAEHTYAVVSGGIHNTADGYAGFVGGGHYNFASGTYTAIAGGNYNSAEGDYSTVPGGYAARATHYGEMSYASGGFSLRGDAQMSFYVLRREKTCLSGIWYNLYLDGDSERITIPSGRTVTFEALVVGRTQAGESAGYIIQGVIENVGGTTTLLASQTTTLGEDDAAWDAKAEADDEEDVLAILVHGNDETIRWVATVRTAEVSY